MWLVSLFWRQEEQEKTKEKRYLGIVALPNSAKVFGSTDVEPLDRILTLYNCAGSEANGRGDGVWKLVLQTKKKSGLACVVKAQKQNSHGLLLLLFHPPQEVAR